MTDLRCQFDSSGWLQGPIAITHVMTPNCYDSGFAVNGQGVVFHTEDGFEAGTVATFLDPSSQVSAFFSIGIGGACHQYLPVGQGYCAWTQMAGNRSWRGVENEDQTSPSTPLTTAQVTAFAQILEACSAYDGFPLQVTDDVNGTGLILHSDGGIPWGDHPDCPGSVRADQRPRIIAYALAIRAGISPAPTVAVWVCEGQNSLAALCSGTFRNGVSTVLRLTAEKSPQGLYVTSMASYIDSVFAASHEDVPAGVVVWHPAASVTLPFTSRGDQTLQGLANAWHCDPSAIVRCTAERSPGAVFGSAMANYLDTVFAASSLKVPAGTSLYYEKG
jgi:hypothetical protein